MSIIKNGKIIAGNYNVSSASDATEEKRGIIRIATDEEAKAGELTNVAITPKQLAENSGSSDVDIDAYTKEEVNSLLDGKQDVLNVASPLAIDVTSLGGVTGYNLKEGYLTPEYPTAITPTLISNGVVLSRSNITTTSTFSDLFNGSCSYFDVPTTLGEEVKKVINGEKNKTIIDLCLGGALETSTHKYIFILGNYTDNLFTPIFLTFVDKGNTTSTSWKSGQTNNISYSSGKVTINNLQSNFSIN